MAKVYVTSQRYTVQAENPSFDLIGFVHAGEYEVFKGYNGKPVIKARIEATVDNNIHDRGQVYEVDVYVDHLDTLEVRELQPINFIGLINAEGEEIWRTLTHCWGSGFGYNQIGDIFYQKGYYISERQWYHFSKLIDEQLYLDQKKSERAAREVC